MVFYIILQKEAKNIIHIVKNLEKFYISVADFNHHTPRFERFMNYQNDKIS